MALAVAGKPSGGSDTLVLQGWEHSYICTSLFTCRCSLGMLPLRV